MSKTPIRIWENVTHDDVCYYTYNYGSDIYDLYIVYKLDTGYLVQNYHRKDLFDGSDNSYHHHIDYLFTSEEEYNKLPWYYENELFIIE